MLQSYLHRTFLVVAMCLLIEAPTQADIVFSLDMDSTTSGIQSSVASNVGGNIQVNLFMSGTGNVDSVGAYQVSLRFDPTKLQITGGGEITPVGWVETDTQLRLIGTQGVSNTPIAQLPGDGNAYLLRIGSDIAVGPTTPFAPLLVGTFSFNVLNTTNNQLTVGLFEKTPLFQFNLDSVLNSSFADASNTFVGSTGTITAVPEPSSLLLGIAAIPIVRRWRSRGNRVG
jgi:hypothetical protein